MAMLGFLTIPWLGPKHTEPRATSVPKAKLGHTELRALSVPKAKKIYDAVVAVAEVQ